MESISINHVQSPYLVYDTMNLIFFKLLDNEYNEFSIFQTFSNTIKLIQVFTQCTKQDALLCQYM